MLVERVLGSNGDKFLSHRLSTGGWLSKMILRHANRLGPARSPLPADIKEIDTLNLEHGGIMSRVATFDWLEESVGKTLHWFHGGSILVEDVWAKPEDRWLENSNVSRLIVCKTVIYGSNRVENPSVRIKDVIKEVSSFNFVGVLAAHNINSIDMGDPKNIDRVLRASCIVIASAYDQEGVVMADLN